MIRNAIMTDVRSIHALVNVYAKTGLLLGRSVSSIYDNLRDFVVYEVDGEIIGVCCLHIVWDDLAEVRSLAVAESAQGKGVGKALVEICLKEAQSLKITKIFSLTYQDGFFRKLGFFDIDKKDLPHKIWSDCLNCPHYPDCNENALLFDWNAAEELS